MIGKRGNGDCLEKRGGNGFEGFLVILGMENEGKIYIMLRIELEEKVMVKQDIPHSSEIIPRAKKDTEAHQ